MLDVEGECRSERCIFWEHGEGGGAGAKSVRKVRIKRCVTRGWGWGGCEDLGRLKKVKK